MARRVKIILPDIKEKEIEIGEKTIKVSSEITLEQYEKIVEDIKDNVLYNTEIEDKYTLLRLRYIKNVLELCTNIDVDNIEAEALNSSYLRDILTENIINFSRIEKYLDKEYDKWVMENCFGILAHKIPDSKDMEKSMNKLSETINQLPEDKLEMIAKSIVWNNMPALGNTVVPATHKESENIVAEA